MVEDEVLGFGLKKVWVDELFVDRFEVLVFKFVSEDYIYVVVVGLDVGKFFGVFYGWVMGEIGLVFVLWKIEV